MQNRSTFVGSGTVVGNMISLGSYPAVRLISNGYPITGEIFSVDDDTIFEQLLKDLDQIEGYPNLYDRVVTTVNMDDGTQIDAIIYVAGVLIDFEHYQQIKSGDWFDAPGAQA